MKRKKVIIDTDPGADDALAIALALNSNELDVLGMTISYGNASVQQCYRNAQFITKMMKKEIPLFLGSSKPLERTIVFSDEYCGKDGLCNYLFETDEMIRTEDPSDFIWKCCMENEELWILAIAPVTNLAKAILKYPEIKNRNVHVVTLAGYYQLKSKQTGFKERLEWNYATDPEAFATLCDTNWTLHGLGLDVTSQLTHDLVDSIMQAAGASDIFKFFTHCADFNRKRGLHDFSLLVDPMAVAYCVTNGCISDDVHGKIHIDKSNLEDYHALSFCINDQNHDTCSGGFDFDAYIQMMIERIFK